MSAITSPCLYCLTPGPGDVLLVPPGVEHFAETIGDQPVVDLSIFTPRRDQYAAEESIG